MFSLQVIIIALLIAFLVGLLIGYILVQGRLQRQQETLKANQRQLTELEESYEARLRDTTQQLRSDYESELEETIEHYQDQLSDKTVELQQNYETRLKVLQQGLTTAAEEQQSAAVRGTIDSPDEVEAPLTQPEVLHFKRQYETRLKEAAQKLQHAYEKQLAQHAKNVTTELQADYEKRLAEKIEHYDEQFSARNMQLEKEYARRYEALSQREPIDPPPTETLELAPPSSCHRRLWQSRGRSPGSSSGY
ncbi:MAG: DUF1049 domain-containing protein [Leptolyngbya sp. SIO1D8]|nr:DUF1049 domain-containing protein [Leptolyngbya sp. SIO1D8]